MTIKRLIVIAICFSVVFVVGCDKLQFGGKKSIVTQEGASFTPTGTVVALVNNYPITLEDLQQEIDQINENVAKDNPNMQINTKEKKIDYLKNELVRRILLYQEGLDRGLARDYDIQNQLEKTKQQLVVLKLLQEFADKITVSNQEIETYYESYKEQLKAPEERKISEIVVSSESQAKDLLIRLLQGERFSGLARQYSRVASAANGGDLGWVKPGEKFKEFDEVAFSGALGPGQISSVFKGKEGYYIIEIEDRKGGEQRSLSDMWEDIKRALTFIKQQQELEKLIGDLSRNAKIEIKEDKVN